MSILLKANNSFINYNLFNEFTMQIQAGNICFYTDDIEKPHRIVRF